MSSHGFALCIVNKYTEIFDKYQEQPLFLDEKCLRSIKQAKLTHEILMYLHKHPQNSDK